MNNMIEKDVLKLTVKKEWFDLMVTGEKTIEIRNPSKWIMSRLKNKLYNHIQFTNGYRTDSPKFIAEYMGYGTEVKETKHQFSNGSSIISKPGDIVIFFSNPKRL
jgi:hypothetical protein